MKMKIEIGDRVVIRFCSGTKMYGKVIYIPCATGDSWIIQESVKQYDVLHFAYSGDPLGPIHYVQQFEIMTPLPDPAVSSSSDRGN